MDGVALDALGKPFAHSACFRVRRIGRAHQHAQISDGVFFFQGKRNNRPAGHESGERIKERTLAMDRVKALGLLFGDFQHLHADDPKALGLDHAKDLAGGAFGHGIRFDNRKSALQSLHSWCLPFLFLINAYAFARAPILLSRVSASTAGDLATVIPAASSALIFSAAVPCPPEMIAPACPMRRPGGAVCPAMNATTGFLTCCFTYSAAVSSALPPISPIIIMASLSGSCLKSCSECTKLIPIIGSPPIPIAVDCPTPRCVSWKTASYVSVPERETIPMFPSLCMCPGMMPILHLPGEMMPGQFGPVSRRLPFG